MLMSSVFIILNIAARVVDFPEPFFHTSLENVDRSALQAEVGESYVAGKRVQDTHYHLFPVLGWKCGNTKIYLSFPQLSSESAILCQPRLVYLQVGKNFYAGYNGGLEVLGQDQGGDQNAVYPESHSDPVFERLNVNVRCP